MDVNTTQNCFWLFRYLERAEILARTLLSGYFFNLDNHILFSKEEDILLALSSDKALFSQLYPHKNNDNELVQYFLTWQEVNPNALANNIKNARENAKVIRNIIGENIWNSINKLHVWLLRENAKNLYLTDRYHFYANFLRSFQLIKGFFYSSFVQDVHTHIMEIGLNLERALQALRLVNYLAIYKCEDPSFSTNDKNFNLMKFLLECQASTDCFLKMRHQFDKGALVSFLLFEQASLHSFITCLHKIIQAFSNIKLIESEFASNEQLDEIKSLKTSLEAMEKMPFLSEEALNEQHKIYLILTKVTDIINLSSQNIESRV